MNQLLELPDSILKQLSSRDFNKQLQILLKKRKKENISKEMEVIKMNQIEII